MPGPYLVTTVNVVVPVSLQEHVGRLHRLYQPDKPMKLPAHFSVLHPFVGYHELDAGLARLRALCAGLKPAEVVVDGYAAFPGVVYLKARDPEPLRVISRALCGEFPECPLYGGYHGPELNPHVTVFEPCFRRSKAGRERHHADTTDQRRGRSRTPLVRSVLARQPRLAASQPEDP